MFTVAEIPWSVKVFTSDKANAGTDANVHLVLYGKDGKSDDIVLNNEGNNFERGQSDEFKLQIDEVGLPFKIRIGHDNGGAAPGWHLNKVCKSRLAVAVFQS